MFLLLSSFTLSDLSCDYECQTATNMLEQFGIRETLLRTHFGFF